MILPPDILHVRRAIRTWRDANPGGLVSALIALHEREHEQALVLANYIERYYGSAWSELVQDVAKWPQNNRGKLPRL